MAHFSTESSIEIYDKQNFSRKIPNAVLNINVGEYSVEVYEEISDETIVFTKEDFKRIVEQLKSIADEL